MPKSVRIWWKKQLRLEPLTFRQRQVVEIGSAGLLSVFQRIAQARGPEDGPAKPLTVGYARYKSRRRLGNRRNLFLTGQMLGSLKLRTVNDNRAYASVGANARRENRIIARRNKNKQIVGMRKFTNKDVAWINQQREPWLVFSPANRRAVLDKACQVLSQIKDRIVRIH